MSQEFTDLSRKVDDCQRQIRSLTATVAKLEQEKLMTLRRIEDIERKLGAVFLDARARQNPIKY